jgi:hypothetical protein
MRVQRRQFLTSAIDRNLHIRGLQRPQPRRHGDPHHHQPNGRAGREGTGPGSGSGSGSGRIPRLSGSASTRDKTLTVTLTNPSLEDTVSTRLRVAGSARVREARASVLTNEDMHATNTFERPNAVGLTPLKVEVSGETAAVTLPKQSVATVTLDLV